VPPSTAASTETASRSLRSTLLPCLQRAGHRRRTFFGDCRPGRVNHMMPIVHNQTTAETHQLTHRRPDDGDVQGHISMGGGVSDLKAAQRLEMTPAYRW